MGDVLKWVHIGGDLRKKYSEMFKRPSEEKNKKNEKKKIWSWTKEKMKDALWVELRDVLVDLKMLSA